MVVRATYEKTGGEERLLALLDPAQGGDMHEPWMLQDSEAQVRCVCVCVCWVRTS